VNRVATSRREALRAGALAAGAVAVGGLVSPLRAAAQVSQETEDLRDFLGPAIAREQITALAYAEADTANGVDAGLKRSLERFREQTQAHVNALTSAIESIGYDAADAPSDPQDDGAFDGADGIDSDTATELSDLLAKVGEPKNAKEFLELLIELELDEIGVYLDQAAALDSEDLRTTSAQIAANQAQHLVVLRQANDVALAETLKIDAGSSGGAEVEGN
jgi:hypothetical protein